MLLEEEGTVNEIVERKGRFRIKKSGVSKWNAVSFLIC